MAARKRHLNFPAVLETHSSWNEMEKSYLMTTISKTACVALIYKIYHFLEKVEFPFKICNEL